MNAALITSGAISAVLAAVLSFLCYNLGYDTATAECAAQRRAERVKPLPQPQTMHEHYPQAAVPPRFAELAKKLERKP